MASMIITTLDMIGFLLFAAAVLVPTSATFRPVPWPMARSSSSARVGVVICALSTTVRLVFVYVCMYVIHNKEVGNRVCLSYFFYDNYQWNGLKINLINTK